MHQLPNVHLVQGIYTDNEVQMVFVDTPGIHKPQNKLGKVLNKQAFFLRAQLES